MEHMASFGDRVRVRESAETTVEGLAGLEGDVYGFTTPSVTGVTVVGGAPNDHAINVHLEKLSTDRWFRPDLLELLHHNVGAEMVVGNVKAVRQPDGSWSESVMPSRAGLLTRLRSWFKR